MLIKNQSEKRNSWKYYVLITILGAFFLLCVTEVTAKEKQQFVTENDSNIENIDVYKIRKTTTDTELNDIRNNLKKYHNVKFEMSDIKRNNSNYLTSIIVEVKKGKQYAKSNQNTENQEINEFGVVVITYKNGDKAIGIQTISNSKDGKATISVSAEGKKKSLNSALLVIDGYTMPSNFDADDINPNDIESMNVLKGIDATGKYGDAGKNGVIEIETRK